MTKSAPEEKIFFRSANLMIEGMYGESDTQKAVVISHPHPKMGGSMWNNVVETIVLAYRAKNYTTLRFNFRGVGRSEGAYDEGRGEQQDILSAVNYLSNRNKTDIVLAGYSFGAWVTTKVISSHNSVQDSILISPPILFLEFDFSNCHGKIASMICGDQDQFTAIDSLSLIAKDIHSELLIIKDADHFFLYKEQAFAETLESCLSRGKREEGFNVV